MLVVEPVKEERREPTPLCSRNCGYRFSISLTLAKGSPTLVGVKRIMQVVTSQPLLSSR